MEFPLVLWLNVPQTLSITSPFKIENQQPLILAQQSSSPSQSVKQAQTGGNYGIGIAMVLVIAVVLAIEYATKKSIFSWLGKPSGEYQQEFAIPVTVSNVRTQDYFKAEIQSMVYVAMENVAKATSLESEDGLITDDTVAHNLKDKVDAAIREVACTMLLDEIHGQKRREFSNEVRKSLNISVASVGLKVTSVAITTIEENNNYHPDNYFDAKAIQKRTEIIQSAILQTRQQELETKPQIRDLELKIEKAIREKELDSQKIIREKELEIEKEILVKQWQLELATRQEELETKPQIREKELGLEKIMREKELAVEMEIEAKELEFQKTSLKNAKTLEIEKINCEGLIERHRSTAENLLEKEKEKAELDTNKFIETYKAEVEGEIEQFKTKQTAAVEIAKMEEDKQVAKNNKDLQIEQAEYKKELEIAELKFMMEMIEQEKEKLAKEKEKAEEVEAITTAVELKQVERENQKTKLMNTRLESEAQIMERLAEAEEKRYKAVPTTDIDRLVKLIRDELIDKDKLPEIENIAKALAPQKGVLGDSSVYTFANGNGEDLNKLMLSTSGMQLINSLLNKKLGKLLDQKSVSQKEEDDQDKDSQAKIFPF